MSIDREAAFAKWWNDEGSAMRPLASEDTEEFAKRITAIAWSNGAFLERKALLDVIDGYSGITLSQDEFLCNSIRARGQA